MSSVSYFLEEFDLTSDDGEDSALNLPGLASDGVPGLIGLFEFDDSLSAPIIDNGKVRMPRGGGRSKLVEFGSGISSPISGVLVGMSFATGIVGIFAKNGEVYFPLAQCPAAPAPGCTVSSIPGALWGATSDENLAGGGIYNGLLYFPLADESSNRPGFIFGVTRQPGYPLGGIRNGLLYFPYTDELRGVVDTGGTSRLWSEVVSSVGEQFEVASISLRVGSNTYVPLSLNVGRNSSGYLTFSFSS